MSHKNPSIVTPFFLFSPLQSFSSYLVSFLPKTLSGVIQGYSHFKEPSKNSNFEGSGPREEDLWGYPGMWLTWRTYTRPPWYCTRRRLVARRVRVGVGCWWSGSP